MRRRQGRQMIDRSGPGGFARGAAAAQVAIRCQRKLYNCKLRHLKMVLTIRRISYYTPQTRQKYHRNTLRWLSRPRALYYKCNTTQYKCKLTYYKCILTYYKCEHSFTKVISAAGRGPQGGGRLGGCWGDSCRALRGGSCCGPAGCWLLRPCGDCTEVLPVIGQGRRAGSTGIAAADSRQQIRPQLLPPRKKGPCCWLPSLQAPQTAAPLRTPACCSPHAKNKNSHTNCMAVEPFRLRRGVFTVFGSCEGYQI